MSTERRNGNNQHATRNFTWRGDRVCMGNILQKQYRKNHLQGTKRRVTDIRYDYNCIAVKDN